MTGQPLLGLVMIVKDEAEGILETIQSVLGVVDCYTIVDTGSTDGTPEIIRSAFGNTPGEVVHEDFVDYSTTRNRAIDLAERASIFSLMLSGDEILGDALGLREFLETKCKSTAGAYNIGIRMANDAWKATRITRSGGQWRYVGVTHEVCVGPNGPEILETAPGLIVHETKRRTIQKMTANWQRDVVLLTAQLALNPWDTRSTFYLAQSYEMLGQYELASYGYQKRIDLGGWREEIYESLLRIAKLKVAMNHPWPECQEAFLLAYSFSPHRAEPLVAISRHYISQGRYHLAELYLGKACSLGYPSNDLLFVDPTAYDCQELLTEVRQLAMTSDTRVVLETPVRTRTPRVLTGDLDIDDLRRELGTTKVFVSLTTIPSRMRQLGLAVASIERQRFRPDEILLGLPETSKREGVPYDIPHQELLERVTVVRTEDRGPATKLYCALEYIGDFPDAIIITVDDDVEYEEHILEKLVDMALRHPDAAIGFCGWNVEKLLRSNQYGLIYEEVHRWPVNPTPVNIVEGYRGVAYRRRFFGTDVLDYEGFPEGAFFVDDVWFSGYLARKGIPRLLTHYSDVALTGEDVWGRIWKQHGLSDGLHCLTNFMDHNRSCASAFEEKDPGIWARDFVPRPRIFDAVNLTMDEQRQRDKPYRYLRSALGLLGPGKKTIVEIGSVRHRLMHPIEENLSDCCIDGHSTYIWAASGHRVVSVDIAPAHAEIARSIPGVEAVSKDGIEFLREFEDPIDLLFLDAWDVVDGTPYAEKHLEAFLAAKEKLAPKHVIVIDDTDIGGGGKGRLLVPHLLENGYHCLMSGRQTILSREPGVVRLDTAPTAQPEMEATFSALYQGSWGGKSGPGSAPEYTEGYRDFLSAFLAVHKIERVIDLGCGDWSFSRLMNWDGISYHGVDCVWSVISANRERFSRTGILFEHASIQDYPLPDDDTRTLVIAKDVLQHWPGRAVENFLDRLEESTAMALLVNCDVGPGVNREIVEGDWRPLALNAPPFCSEFEEVFRFHTKSVLLAR